MRTRAPDVPRTLPVIDAESYSGRRSLSLCRFALFIELSLAPGRSTGADDADGVVSLRVGHNQDVSPRGCTDCQETGLRLGVRLVGKRRRQRILENRGGLVEADTMPLEVRRSLCRIPFELHRKSIRPGAGRPSNCRTDRK